ncbi:hypothetical protein KAR91_47830 [Candidatus Pacearchaeota archaeon]|nr:hypothetical protein [Candidatus Pacearchaeota archaeon]
MAVQTYSIEIFTGKRCENNAYGVEPFSIKTMVDELLTQIPVSALFNDEGLDIQIRKEQ